MKVSEKDKMNTESDEKSLRSDRVMRFIMGDRFYIYSWCIPFFLFYFIPWDSFSEVEYVASFHEILKGVFPAIDNLESSGKSFSYFASLHLALVNFVGFSFAVFYVVYCLCFIDSASLKHMSELDPKSVGTNMLLLGFAALVVFPYAFFNWDGSIPEKYPNVFINTKEAFVFTSVLVWWVYLLVLSAFSLCLRCFFSIFLSQR